MKELSNYVVENLGDVYPELEKNVKLVYMKGISIVVFL